MATVEIIVIGKEILLGVVVDTNSSYLCRVVRGTGGEVRHIAVVGDQESAIGDEIRASIERRADLILTCGGLGPTADDLTLAAIAKATGSRLILDAEAREFVTRKYEELFRRGDVSSAQLNESRLKMAWLPEGSRVVENPAGAAPAIVLGVKGSLIAALPGVPAELKSIVEGPLAGMIGEILGGSSYREQEIVVDCGDESVLAPLLTQLIASHPNVYIKSRARHFGPEVKFRILVAASASTAEAASELIQRASEDLTRALESSGIAIINS